MYNGRKSRWYSALSDGTAFQMSPFCRMKATLSGCLAFASPPIAATPLSSPAAGTRWSRWVPLFENPLPFQPHLFNDLKMFACIIQHTLRRFLLMRAQISASHDGVFGRCGMRWSLSLPPRCGTLPTASWRPTTLATLATWTQWPSLLMAPSVHLVERWAAFSWEFTGS